MFHNSTPAIRTLLGHSSAQILWLTDPFGNWPDGLVRLFSKAPEADRSSLTA